MGLLESFGNVPDRVVGYIGEALDRTLGVFSPAAEFRRREFRQAVALSRRYEAASQSRQHENWLGAHGSADTEVRMDLRTLQARSRELTQNNSWMRSGVNALQTDLVGPGILAKVRAPGGRDEQAQDDWRRFAESTRCDWRGQSNFYALQSIGARTLIESGEFLVRRIYDANSPFGIKLLFLEPDHLDTTKDGQLLNDGGRIVQGVEYDALARRVAYHLWREHPGESNFGWRKESDRIAAADVIHCYQVLRFGQTRGIPHGAACMVRLKQFDDFELARITKERIAACFTAFVHDMNADGGNFKLGISKESAAGTSSDLKERRFVPGLIQNLPPGKTVSFGQPPTVQGYAEFSTITLQAISQALEVTYERLTGDLKRVNFASGKMGAVKYNQALDRITWLTIIPQLCERVWEWLQEGLARKNPSSPLFGATATWTPPARPLVDPVREIPALGRAIRLGLRTRSSVVRELGNDAEAVEREFQEDNRRADALGLVFDSDGRHPEGYPNPPEPKAKSKEKDGSKQASD